MNRYIDVFWDDFVQVFIERFLIVVCAAAFYGIVITDAMKIELHYRIGVGIILVGIAYTLGYAVHQANVKVKAGPIGTDGQDTKVALKQPRFREKVDRVYFMLGRNGTTMIYNLDLLKRTPAQPFDMGGFKPIKLYVEGDQLFADVTVSGPRGEAPIEIKHNDFTVRLPGFDKNSDDAALEVVNQQQQPIFQMIYVSNFQIQILGFLTYPGGIVIGDNNGMRIVSEQYLAANPQQVSIDRIFKYPSSRYAGVREKP